MAYRTMPELHVAETIMRYRYRWRTEDDLQAAIFETLAASGFEPRREVRLSERDRIDLMVGRVGVEIKVAGEPPAVLRQLGRYAESDDVDALVLVTARARHIQLPADVLGKPLVIRTLGSQGL